ncbi:MAG: LysE family transporter [Desulfococcaceae bacterium]|jgi:threonine/homoserine/homoserine lactone efflux protein|nr:LysE family transporter [Desulfococcaceae bacterium]
MAVLTGIFFTSFLIALSGAMMPGPLFTVTISESSRRGFLAGPLLIAGHALLELALVLALMTGLAPFLKQNAVLTVIAFAGSAILLWMAWGMFRALPSLSLQYSGEEKKSGNLLLAGALLSLANPYWTIWWVSIGLGYILHSMEAGKPGVFSFFCGHILGDLFWYSAISLAVWRGKAFLSDRAYRYLIGTCAVILVAFSCIFAYSGYTRCFSG